MSVVHVIDQADAATLSGFDAVIDVRSPGEFAEDHIPGAENLPVLSDAERAEVGTLYVQTSRFEARRRGAAYVAANISAHLRGALADRPHTFHPLVYCWRGGQRSNATATILSQVGWRTGLLQGGYKTYRRMVQHRLYDTEPGFRLVLLDGHTGTGKTEILGRLAARGVQVLDLEALAGHRGSLFGGLPGRDQPSQKLFETRLLSALDAFDPTRPIMAEAESAKVGQRSIPPLVWKAMQAAPRMELAAPPEARARYLAQAYGDAAKDLDALQALLERLPRLGRKRVAEWMALARDGDLQTLAAGLIEHHYDPSYDRSAQLIDRPRLAVVSIDALDDASLDLAAIAIGEAAGVIAPED